MIAIRPVLELSVAIMAQTAYTLGLVIRGESEEVIMEQTIFIICMFLGVVSVALIAFTLLGIVLGRIKV